MAESCTLSWVGTAFFVVVLATGNVALKKNDWNVYAPVPQGYVSFEPWPVGGPEGVPNVTL
jgi:hypothetical protein